MVDSLNKITKNILIHLLLWTFYISLSIMASYAATKFSPEVEFYPWDLACHYLAVMFLFYFTRHVVLDKFYDKKYFIATILLITAVAGFYLLELGRVLVAILEGDLEGVPPYFLYFPSLFFAFFQEVVINISLATLAWMYFNSKREQKISLDLVKKTHEAQMNFLKSQLNQHFLYNTLNSFYSDALFYSEKLANGILSLANLLRYSWSIDKNEIITIEEEIKFLNSYLNLQKMRFEDQIEINLEVNPQLKEEKFIHMGLITLCENAFKYGDLHTKPLIININKHNNILEIYFENVISKMKQPVTSSKLGIENLKNRLNLLFPQKHNLEIKNDLETFIVILKISQD